MNQTDFVESLRNNYDKGVELMVKKNKDYANSNDPFKNFKTSTVIGVTPPRAILVRILDKITRISNLLDKEAEVKDERIEDTLIDCMNYLNILLVYLQNEEKTRVD